MRLFVSEEEWLRLSPHARDAVVRTLREHGLLPEGQELQVSPQLPPLGELGEQPSVRDPAVAAALRATAPEGREAVSVTVFTSLETGQTKEVCFVVTYAPPGYPLPTARAFPPSPDPTRRPPPGAPPPSEPPETGA